MADGGGEMKNDAFYAEMIGMMREQGKKDNPITLQLGVMQSSNSCLLYTSDAADE